MKWLGASVVSWLLVRTTPASANAAGDWMRQAVPRIRSGRVEARAERTSRGTRGQALAIVDAPLAPLLRRVFEVERLAGYLPGIDHIRVLSRRHGHRDVVLRLRDEDVRGHITITGHDDGTHVVHLRLADGLGDVRMVFAHSPGGNRTLLNTSVRLHASLLPIGPTARWHRNGAISVVAGIRRLSRGLR